jgi:tRNA threonylcarbamoyladenosine biosynthesis protein TsaE
LITFENGLQINLPDLLSTEALASSLANALIPGLTIYLHGNLGAGKTTLVRAMLVALGHIGAIKSPTYSLVELYNLQDLELYHFDLYRLADPSELEYMGIRDYITPTAVCMFEWADKGIGHIPFADIEIKLEFMQQGRKAIFSANSNQGIEVLQDMTIGM